MTAQALRQSMLKKIPSGVLHATASFLVAAALWEITARFLVKSPLFFVPLPKIFAKAVSLWQQGELQTHIQVSGIEFLSGFGLAAAVGILIGAALSASPAARRFFEPWISMLYATPIIALGPLFILALGIDVWSKIVIIFLTAVFPIIINTIAGLTTTDRNLIEAARSFGATPGQVQRKVRVPAALPFIIAGLRLGVARALVGVVVAELFGARAGLGFLILTSAQNFDTAALFVGVLILAITGVVSVEFLKWLEARLAPWRYEEGQE
jgi:ABC-type nitrate/sulfonate/bicarbonate transport system permease component